MEHAAEWVLGPCISGHGEPICGSPPSPGVLWIVPISGLQCALAHRAGFNSRTHGLRVMFAAAIETTSSLAELRLSLCSSQPRLSSSSPQLGSQRHLPNGSRSALEPPIHQLGSACASHPAPTAPCCPLSVETGAPCLPCLAPACLLPGIRIPRANPASPSVRGVRESGDEP